MTNRVPLHSFEAFKFRSKIIVEPIFNEKLCGGITGKSSEFKNSTGSTAVSMDLNVVSFPGNDYRILKLIA